MKNKQVKLFYFILTVITNSCRSALFPQIARTKERFPQEKLCPNTLSLTISKYNELSRISYVFRLLFMQQNYNKILGYNSGNRSGEMGSYY